MLCLLLLVWQPIRVGLAASGALDALALGGAPLALMLCARIVVAGLGVGAGLALLGRRSGAVTLARIALVASAMTDLVVFLTPYFPSSRAPGETPIFVGASLAYHLGWLLYLSRSRKVRAIFATPAELQQIIDP